RSKQATRSFHSQKLRPAPGRNSPVMGGRAPSGRAGPGQDLSGEDDFKRHVRGLELGRARTSSDRGAIRAR
ncbi:hypothetical protein, partial [Rhodovulum sulfidophilum]|uniref:hypothetical protein n=1 Tax=Rhodovulum sulfidophilum TaxID=35806 RepID=UPI001F3D177E